MGIRNLWTFQADICVQFFHVHSMFLPDQVINTNILPLPDTGQYPLFLASYQTVPPMNGGILHFLLHLQILPISRVRLDIQVPYSISQWVFVTLSFVSRFFSAFFISSFVCFQFRRPETDPIPWCRVSAISTLQTSVILILLSFSLSPSSISYSLGMRFCRRFPPFREKAGGFLGKVLLHTRADSRVKKNTSRSQQGRRPRGRGRCFYQMNFLLSAPRSTGGVLAANPKGGGHHRESPQESQAHRIFHCLFLCLVTTRNIRNMAVPWYRKEPRV